MITIPYFEDKSRLFDWLVENKTLLINQKKSEIKHADAFLHLCPLFNDKGVEVKSEAIPATVDKIKVRSIINTTKLFDSHQDVHIDGLWNKSLKESKDNYLVNQHNFKYEGIISDNVHAFAKHITWAELGFPGYEGTTQALVYDSVISKAESPFMFEKYRAGKVKQHSVGMRYLKLEMAINDKRYEKEYAVWEKYFDIIVNKSDAEEAGVFWPVLEAKNIEGSAVLMGSNHITPTQSVSAAKYGTEIDINEPLVSTQKEIKFINPNFY